jgi:hypothetical protein
MQIFWPTDMDTRFRAVQELLQITVVYPQHVVDQARDSIGRWLEVMGREAGKDHGEALAAELTDVAGGLIRILDGLSVSAVSESAVDIGVHTEQINNTLNGFIVRYQSEYPPGSLDENVMYTRILRDLEVAGEVTGAIRHRFAAASEREENERQQRELTELALKEAEEAASRAGRAADAAQASAGHRGAFDLSSYFGTYGKTELRTANLFRIATLGALMVIVAAAIFVPHTDLGDLSGIVYRIAILAALSALVAYLSSQSSHHRKTGVWARSMQIQLQSFPAFIEPLAAGESRDAIYVSFASRVLGAPPASTKNASHQDPALMQAVVDVLLKRAAQ